MTGIDFLTLTVVSMGWLFFLAGLVMNYRLMKLGWEVPWPWFWILLPLVLDPGCVPGLLRRLRK